MVGDSSCSNDCCNSLYIVSIDVNLSGLRFPTQAEPSEQLNKILPLWLGQNPNTKPDTTLWTCVSISTGQDRWKDLYKPRERGAQGAGDGEVTDQPVLALGDLEQKCWELEWKMVRFGISLSHSLLLFAVVRMVHWRWRIVRLFVLETHGCWQHFLGCCQQIAGEMCYSKKTKKVGKQRVQTCGQVDSGQFHFSFWDTWLTWLLFKLARKASFRTCPWDTAIRGLLWLISAVQNWTLTTTIHRLWLFVYHGLSCSIIVYHLFSVVYHHLSSFSRFKLPYLSGWQGAEGLQMTQIFPGGYLCLLPGSKSASSFRLWGLPRCHCS